VAQALDGRVDVYGPGADLFEQAAQMILIHTSSSVARTGGQELASFPFAPIVTVL
jgi:hypothetical protein